MSDDALGNRVGLDGHVAGRRPSLPLFLLLQNIRAIFVQQHSHLHIVGQVRNKSADFGRIVFI